MLSSVIQRLLRWRQARTDGWLERATALQQAGRYEEAAAVCEQRLRNARDDTAALDGLAAALLAQGRTGEGLLQLRKAAAFHGDRPAPHVNLGLVLAATGRLAEAADSYRRALAIQPTNGGATDALVGVLRALERYEEIEDRCRAAIELSGDTAARRHALAVALFEQGRVDEAIAELEHALALQPDSAVVHSNLLRALNYADGRCARDIFEAHLAWARHHETPRLASAQALSPDRNPGRRLRVGYVSQYFAKHPVTFFLASAIEHHDRDAFDIVLFADVARPDAYSERLRSYGAQWRSTVGASDAALAQMVRDERIDILVDLAGHTGGNRLLAFAEQPAPVQVTWNGYPNTTGMRSIAYRITDAPCDPPGETEHLHSETLVRLPHIFMSWQPPDDAPEPGPLPRLAAGHVTFGSFNACYKITPTTARLWSHVLEAVPDSRLILFVVPGARAVERLRELFAACGIGTGRIEFRPRLSHEAFLAAHREVDIALDSFPYHGTTTTCFSLWMGVPVVCLTGVEHRSRVGLTLLSAIGLPELAAASSDGLVHTAARLAGNVDALAALRAGLRRRMLESTLTDGQACARALEGAYRDMWRTWCCARS